MLLPMLFVSGILLALFYVIDRLAWNRESAEVKGKSRSPRHIEIDGLHNVLYLMAIALVVLASGIWFREVTFPIGLGLEMPINGLIRDIALVAISLLLLVDDPAKHSGGERVHLGADAGGGAAVRRHLHHHDPRAGSAEGRQRGTVRAAAHPGLDT